MKFEDRVPTKPRYRTIKNVETGETITAIISYADEPSQEGTPLNAKNLNNITTDIVDQLNDSPMGIVRDKDGTVAMNITSNHKQIGDLWSYSDDGGVISFSNTNSSKTIEISLTVTPKNSFYFYYPAFEIGYESGVNLSSSYPMSANVHMYDYNNVLIGSKTFSFSSNSGGSFEYYYPTIYEYLNGYGNGTPLPINYKIVLSVGKLGGIQNISGLYLHAYCYSEQKYIFKGVE